VVEILVLLSRLLFAGKKQARQEDEDFEHLLVELQWLVLNER